MSFMPLTGFFFNGIGGFAPVFFWLFLCFNIRGILEGFSLVPDGSLLEWRKDAIQEASDCHPMGNCS